MRSHSGAIGVKRQTKLLPDSQTQVKQIYTHHSRGGRLLSFGACNAEAFLCAKTSTKKK